MAEPERQFPRAEFERRLGVIQSGMERHRLDALLLTTPADIFYVTGFLTRFWESPARPWYIVLPARGAPIAVIPAIGAAPVARTWVQDIRTWDAPDPVDDGISLLQATLRETVPDTGAIGLPMGLETHVRMPLSNFATLRDGLAPRRMVDATDVMHRAREIKSEVEIDRIRTACAIADAAFARVPDMAAAGIPLSHVFRRFQAALLDEGADWVSYLAGAADRDGYEDVISPATDAPLRKGDILMLDTGAVHAGYFCDFDRNFAVGPPSDRVRRTHDALHAATEDALQALRPGMIASELHTTLTTSLVARGVQPGGGRLGHGLGVTLTEWPSITAKDTTPLRKNMVLTLEPAAVVSEGRILVHEENIVLRAEGPELLSRRAPETLPELRL